jgi:hypothetical protein
MSHVNSGVEQRKQQIESNLKLGLPEAVNIASHRSQMVIVGGGPSLKNQLPQIRHRKAKKAEVWATNGTHDYLISKGIVPDYMAMLDSREESARFVQKPHNRVTYFIASQCHPSVFEALKGHRVFIWHNHEPELQEAILKNSTSPEILMIPGGSTIGLRLMCLGAALGYRAIHHYGMDSSYEEASHHAYQQSLNDGEEIKRIEYRGKYFICSEWMLTQAEDYENQIEALEKAGVRVFAHGTGLIPFIHQTHIGENYASAS